MQLELKLVLTGPNRTTIIPPLEPSSKRGFISAYINSVKLLPIYRETYFLPSYLYEYPDKPKTDLCSLPNLFQYRHIVIPIYSRHR